MSLEIKFFEFKAEDVSDQGLIKGYASTFGNVDQGLDVVEKGAFKVTLRDNKGKVPILADHNPEKQIGWNKVAREDDTGLYVEGQLNLDVALAKERFSLTKQAMDIGAPMGLSIGYYTLQAGPKADNPRIRLLKELKLVEYSLVTFPMNTQAMITAAKSLNAIDKARDLISQLQKQGVSLRDFELALKEESYKQDLDPAKVCQSIDNLIEKFKN